MAKSLQLNRAIISRNLQKIHEREEPCRQREEPCSQREDPCPQREDAAVQHLSLEDLSDPVLQKTLSST